RVNVAEANGRQTAHFGCVPPARAERGGLAWVGLQSAERVIVMVTHLRMAWVVGGVVAAATVGGCASHSSGSHATAPSSSATLGLTIAPGGAVSPAGLAQASTPTSGGPSNVSSGAPGTQATATATTIVRPIDRGGHLAAGYSAVSEANTDSMVCDRSSVSLVAVDRGSFPAGKAPILGSRVCHLPAQAPCCPIGTPSPIHFLP